MKCLRHTSRVECTFDIRKAAASLTIERADADSIRRRDPQPYTAASNPASPRAQAGSSHGSSCAANTPATPVSRSIQ